MNLSISERPGRRLTYPYPDCHNCKGHLKQKVSHLIYTAQTNNCTEPLSDISNDQGPGNIDGTGDQELDVIMHLRILLKVRCMH